METMEVYNENRTGVMSYKPEDVLEQVASIQHLMNKAMKDGEHFGKIPGCGDKPTLLKAGAEKITFMFRLAPKYEVKEKDLGNGHREYEVKTELVHIPTGKFYGEGLGSCTTMESKYRYRNASLKCPECGKETIIKGKKEYGGGWLCFAKKGGCGAKFNDDDESIKNQETGKIEYDNPADYYNTVLKMAKKRSLVDATLTATAASDIFTQDIEEMIENGSITINYTEVKEIKDNEPEKSQRNQRNYTAEADACMKEKNPRAALELWWKSLTKSERDKLSKSNFLNQYTEQITDLVNHMIDALTIETFSRDYSAVENLIDQTKDTLQKARYIERYTKKITQNKINHKYEPLPF